MFAEKIVKYQKYPIYLLSLSHQTVILNDNYFVPDREEKERLQYKLGVNVFVKIESKKESEKIVEALVFCKTFKEAKEIIRESRKITKSIPEDGMYWGRKNIDRAQIRFCYVGKK
ncbi:MAG: hypothetical protein QNJ54_01565 [Prochloraceae cyanobacterium]|nr:hypothetical protein [Prochloraceae cyanobacterium]